MTTVVMDDSTERIEATFNPITAQITRHEKNLLCYLALGMTRSDIEAHTKIPEGTIKTQLRKLYRKLQANNGIHAVGIGLTYNLINRSAMVRAYDVQFNGKNALNAAD